MSFVLTIAAASAAVGVEMLEALAIILAVGMTCGFRPALFGAAAAVVGVVLLCLFLGLLTPTAHAATPPVIPRTPESIGRWQMDSRRNA